jgi:hypothetical protein
MLHYLINYEQFQKMQTWWLAVAGAALRNAAPGCQGYHKYNIHTTVPLLISFTKLSL